MSKVLHVGITAPTYSSEAITKSFVDVFGECVYFDWQSHRFNYGVGEMRENLLKQAHEVKPDIIFLHLNHNNEVLTVDNIKELQSIGFTITYTEDVREDISWFEIITPLIGLSIFTNIDDVEKLKAQRIFNATYLPVSYNNIWYKPQKRTEKYYGDIVFLGNNYVNTNTEFPQAQQRQDMIAALKKEFGDKFQAYGRGQENEALNPQQAVECYNNAKIAIGHNNFNRKGYQSDRCLNSMGCGCMTIMQEFEGQQDNGYFSNFSNPRLPKWDYYYYFWNDIEHLIRGCNLYLFNTNSEGCDKPHIETVAERQYKEVTENHTWKQRAESILKLIENNA